MHARAGGAGEGKASPHTASAFIALAAFAVYALLTPPASGGGDASEFALVLATGGVAHPTGYPLYTLLGHAFVTVLHAFHTGYPLAAGLWSAAGAAVAVFFLHALAAALMPPARAGWRDVAWRLLVTLPPVALLATHPAVVGEATVAEVNSWSLAWTCSAAYVFVRIVRAIGAGAAMDARWCRAAAARWGIVCGLGLAHHLTSVFASAVFSAAIAAALVRRRRLTRGLLVRSLAAACVPLASVGWIVWHAWHPAAFQWPALEPSWAGVWDHLSAAPYRGFLGRFAPQGSQRELVDGVLPYLVTGLALLVIATLRARTADERLARGGLLAAAGVGTAFAFRYGVGDPAPYFLAPVALGAAAFAPVVASIAAARTRAGVAVLAAIALAASVPVVRGIDDGRERFAGTMLFERTIRSMWSSVPDDTAIVTWADDRFNRLVEYQVFGGEKRAVRVITPDLFYTNSVRREFVARFGVDPAAGAEFPAAAIGTPDAARIVREANQRMVERLNARVRVPVIVFDPTVPVVIQLRKPWEAPASH